MGNITETPNMSVKALVEFYRHLLKCGHIQKNGAAHNRLKFFEDILQRRLKWRNMKKKMPQMFRTP